eukprot:2359265-Amphidinium_carterae.1
MAFGAKCKSIVLVALRAHLARSSRREPAPRARVVPRLTLGGTQKHCEHLHILCRLTSCWDMRGYDGTCLR